MSVPFYFDHNVPVAIAGGLRRLGVDVLRSFDDGAAAWDDDRILTRAGELSRPVVTLDADFLRLADERSKSGRSFSGVIYIKDPNIPVGIAVQDLNLISQAMTIDELESLVMYVPL